MPRSAQSSSSRRPAQLSSQLCRRVAGGACCAVGRGAALHRACHRAAACMQHCHLLAQPRAFGLSRCKHLGVGFESCAVVPLPHRVRIDLGALMRMGVVGRRPCRRRGGQRAEADHFNKHLCADDHDAECGAPA